MYIRHTYIHAYMHTCLDVHVVGWAQELKSRTPAHKFGKLPSEIRPYTYLITALSPTIRKPDDGHRNVAN